jgi:hypothetical protein
MPGWSIGSNEDIRFCPYYHAQPGPVLQRLSFIPGRIVVSDIKWTKTYEVKVDTRVFRIFITQHEGHGYQASCLWYEKPRVLKTPGQSGVTQFHLEQRHSLSEDAVLSDLMLWVNSKFAHDAELTPVQA